MDSTVVAIVISLVVLVAAAAGGTYAYNAGHLDPIIEKIGKYMAKAKAEAALLDGQKQFAEKGVKVLGDEGAEKTEAAQEAVGSVGDGIDLGVGDGDLKKRF
ncbi:hypothetical protein B0T10DRAFT_557671 [Thelonectria olida]|uniref:Uncharacterized protein n=1 Tax=Thelonectria olida TaxID=1576542 RepID=A0A9P8WCA2_9HYPO|nr:hypothetical protein B0T10DRAFT_557671 [Thelonectria olida]